jgi:hypothetical protein
VALGYCMLVSWILIALVTILCNVIRDMLNTDTNTGGR